MILLYGMETIPLILGQEKEVQLHMILQSVSQKIYQKIVIRQPPSFLVSQQLIVNS